MKLSKVNTEEFYPVLEYWWSKHDFPVLTREMLPEEVFVLIKKGVPTHSIFLYETNSKLCWLGFPVSNPDVNPSFKKGCLEKLIELVTSQARKEGFKISFTTSPVERVQEALLNTGYTLGDKEVNHYIKLL